MGPEFANQTPQQSFQPRGVKSTCFGRSTTELIMTIWQLWMYEMAKGRAFQATCPTWVRLLPPCLSQSTMNIMIMNRMGKSAVLYVFYAHAPICTCNHT